jgi:hypothetical protein
MFCGFHSSFPRARVRDSTALIQGLFPCCTSVKAAVVRRTNAVLDFLLHIKSLPRQKTQEMTNHCVIPSFALVRSLGKLEWLPGSPFRPPHDQGTEHVINGVAPTSSGGAPQPRPSGVTKAGSRRFHHLFPHQPFSPTPYILYPGLPIPTRSTDTTPSIRDRSRIANTTSFFRVCNIHSRIRLRSQFRLQSLPPSHVAPETQESYRFHRHRLPP